MKRIHRILNVLTGFRGACIPRPVAPTNEELSALEQAIAILDREQKNMDEIERLIDEFGNAAKNVAVTRVNVADCDQVESDIDDAERYDDSQR